MLVVRVVAVLRARRLAASLLSVKWLVRVGFFLGPPQGRTGVSTQRSKLKKLSAPLLPLPILPVGVAGPSLAFPPRSVSPARRGLRFPLRLDYAAVAVA
jgi:hypothetical protein